MTRTNEKTIPRDGLLQAETGWTLLRGCCAARFSLLGEHLVGGVFEGLCFRQESECLLDRRIPVGHDTETLQLAELALRDLFLDVDLQPVHVVGEVLFGVWNVLAG